MPKTGIVVPCYNEAERLPAQDYARFAARWPQVSFCFVDDGSADDTERVIRETVGSLPGRHSVMALGHNYGKAEAVRAGIRHLCGATDCAFVGYWDADLSTPLGEIPRFLEAAELRPQVRLLCGSRIRRMGATIERHPWRHYLGRAFATAASLALRLPIYDTQCGAKLFEANLARKIFAEPFISRWLFDVELIARTVALLGRSRASAAIFEVPLETWHEGSGSKVAPWAYLSAPRELLCIYLRYRTALE
ncbi:MAG: glycosyltransferase [Candidatus Brocadiae bacterium]|nr:glycosyltransferase [Candidatus Brocadiia bacterium]